MVSTFTFWYSLKHFLAVNWFFLLVLLIIAVNLAMICRSYLGGKNRASTQNNLECDQVSVSMSSAAPKKQERLEIVKPVRLEVEPKSAEPVKEAAEVSGLFKEVDWSVYDLPPAMRKPVTA